MSNEAVTQPVNPLEQALVEVIDRSLKAVDAGVDFLSGQLPDVIHQLLAWKMVESLVKFGLGIGLLVALAFWLRYLWRITEDVHDREFPRVFGTLFPGCIAAVVSSVLVNLTWLQIWVAPKVYLIEYAAQLLK